MSHLKPANLAPHVKTTLNEVIRGLRQDAIYYALIPTYAVMVHRTNEFAEAIECAVLFADGFDETPHRYAIQIWVDGLRLLKCLGQETSARQQAGEALLAAISLSIVRHEDAT